MIVYVTKSDRLLFKLSKTPGKLVGAPAGPQAAQRSGKPAGSRREVECAFASGESLNGKTEETIFQAAEKAKDWEGLIFKLRLEGYDVREGSTLKLPFGKL